MGEADPNKDEQIEKIFAGKPDIKKEDFEPLVTEVCGLPKFFKTPFFERID